MKHIHTKDIFIRKQIVHNQCHCQPSIFMNIGDGYRAAIVPGTTWLCRHLSANGFMFRSVSDSYRLNIHARRINHCKKSRCLIHLHQLSDHVRSAGGEKESKREREQSFIHESSAAVSSARVETSHTNQKAVSYENAD